MTVSAAGYVSNADFRLIAESVPCIVWILAPDGSTEYLNWHGAIYAGLPMDATTGADWMSLVHPDESDRVQIEWKAATSAATPYRLDYEIRRFDGEYRCHAFRGRPILDETGVVLRWIVTATDIDHRKGLPAGPRLEDRELAETLTLLETLQSKSPVGFGFVDRDFRIVRLNEMLAAVNGSTVDEQIGRTVAAVVPQLWPQIEPLYRRVLDHGEAVLDVEINGPSAADPAQTQHWVASYYPVRLRDEIIGVGIVVVNITARKQAEREMRFQAELLDAVGQAIVAVDLNRTVIYWNQAAEDLYGWSSAEAVGQRVSDLFAREETADETRAVFEAMRRAQSWSGDYNVTARDGSTVSVYITYTPMFDTDGRVVAIIGASVDVTDRKTGEESRQQLAAIVEGSGDAIFGVTTHGTIASWNGAAQRLFGYTADEIIGQPIAVLAPEESIVEQAQVRARLNAGGSYERHETTRRRKDGSSVDVLLTASTTTDATGNVTGLSVIAQDITERLATHRALESSQRRLAEAQRIARLGSFEFDVVTGELTWSEEYYRILGLDPAEPPSRRRFVSAVHPDDMPEMASSWTYAIEHGVSFDLAFRIIGADRLERHVRARGAPEMADDGTVVKMAGTMMDDTEWVEADLIRRAAETRFEIGFEQSAIGAVIADLDGIPIRVNPAVCVILGRPEESLVGRRWTEYTHPDEVPLVQAMLDRVAAGHDTYEDERRYLRPDGTTVWASAHVTLVRDSAGAPLYVFTQLQDITRRKLMELELAHLALHDSLTGLPNRALLTDRLLRGLAGSRRRGSGLGVMFLDVDDFKAVNDSCGYGTGDILLKQAADRIAGAIRPDDTVARFGGDEFVVVCDDISTVEIETIAERILVALSEPYQIGNDKIHVTASLGIAIADENATPESLLRDGDAAMHRGKQRGRGRVEQFDEELRVRTERRWLTASALHTALDRDEFTIHYQPVVDLSTGRMVSTEALLRWEHPGRGLISPADFIPLAEQTGLIVPIGALVLERACGQLFEWQRIRQASGDDTNLSMAVNLSVRQMLAPDIAGLIETVLKRTGVQPEDLCLELTESLFMEDVDYFEKTLAALKTLGVALALDDFGMGYSSLGYLKRFPFDAVKIDRAFVDGLGTDPNDTALVTAIVAMADALSLEVIAEGVETNNQLAGLMQLGVPRAQGYYLARPTSADKITQLVTESNHWQLD